MFAIRARRKVASERDFLDAVDKVVRQGTKFSSTYVLQIMVYQCETHITCLALYIRYITNSILSVCHILLGSCIEYLYAIAGKTRVGNILDRMISIPSTLVIGLE